ncbi:membrane-bound PQQ-dependent dehydrogenase, glucose/quinate/shikimate family [Pseudomonas kurunegalensis]|uniref:membrane-bound PQQ-dependent dehydrogenase, glucose/quinate/shikimate family n=1 Tax=Pseudomonas kurunegalensis TaxID=485880 RepID=UPI0035578147
MSLEKQTRTGGWFPPVLGALHALLGLFLVVGGIALAQNGGSWYYLIAGVGMLLSAYYLMRRRSIGIAIYALVFIGTVVWAAYEAGLDYWQWVPRVGIFLALAILNALAIPAFKPEMHRNASKKSSYSLAGVLSLVLVAGFVGAFIPHGVIESTATVDRSTMTPATEGNWAHYGSTAAGTRYAPYGQINKENVDELKVAWTFHTGEVAEAGLEDQNTPLQIDDTVYICTPKSQVIAVDADTGQERWRFNPKSDTGVWQRCRGVSYFDADTGAKYHDVQNSSAQPVAATSCRQRIIVASNDARLMAVDAHTGELCENFGDNGTVQLSQGLGSFEPGIYSQTSAPLIAGDLVILGGRIYDNIAAGLPSGVVRAFSAVTGELVWAWDLGNPQIDRLPPEGETYTKGTPNVWVTPTYDEQLGLVYLPTGNTTPDFWGGNRTEAERKYSSAVVALDVRTGKERWMFQTTHHDVWDYDVPAQPTLYDIPDGKGATVPALIQVTKRGQIFVLDRRNGNPLSDVKEIPVPQNGQEPLSPTQPYSVDMPAIGVDPLSEKRMWGLSVFDQLMCRIQFSKLRYDGDFTPPTTSPSLQWPGFYGGMNWGSAAVNATNDYLIVNDIRLAQIIQLKNREETDRIIEETRGKSGGAGHDGINPQYGTPYGVMLINFMSALGVPCQNPPFGSMTAIDLKTKKIAWQRPLGTVEDTGPLGIATHLPMPIGTPTLSGSLTTQSGLIFYAGTSDYYLRAIDADTGKDLWKGRLPVGGQATPMTYISPKTKKQYVLLTAGGARNSPDRGDYVIAYALPDK